MGGLCCHWASLSTGEIQVRSLTVPQRLSAVPSSMVTIALLTALLSTQPSVIEEKDPATRLALTLAEAVGTEVETLKLSTHGLTPLEEKAIGQALTLTQLFTLDQASLFTLTVTRMSHESVLASLSQHEGPRLWVSQLTWKTPSAKEQAIAQTQDYERQALRVEAFNRSTGTTLWLSSGWGGAFRTGVQENRLRLGGAVTPWPAKTELDWRIIQGAATVVDELKLAQLSGNPELEKLVKDTREERRQSWWMGFGITSLASLTTGALLTWQANDSQDNRQTLDTLGTSLILVGVATGISALFYPQADKRHVLTAQQAQEACDRFNRMLKKSSSGSENPSKKE